jgi:hypothetical protein
MLDYQRIAAMIRECDDDAELAEILAEVYRMLPQAQQAQFRAAISPAASTAPESGWWERQQEIQRQHERDMHASQLADFQRRAAERQARLDTAIFAITEPGEPAP